MESLINIPIIVDNKAHHRFEWNSGEYKKLKAIFCSPDVQLSLVFNDGKQVFLRQFNFEESVSTPPNSRVIFINKELKNEVITGVVSVGDVKSEYKSVYLIVEK